MPCPTGYDCIERKGIGICCIADYATHYCPKSMSPYITNENMILSCDPGLENVCPTLFKCLFSTTLKSNVCCTPIATNEQIPRQSLASYGLPRTEVAAVNLCPNSSEILKNPMGLPQSCQSTDSGEECPPRYLCYYPYFTVPLGFCCSSESKQINHNFLATCSDRKIIFQSFPFHECIPVVNNNLMQMIIFFQKLGLKT